MSEPPREKVLIAAVGLAAVEAADHAALVLRQARADRLVGLLGQERAALVEQHDLGRVDEVVAEQRGDDVAVDELAAAGAVVGVGAARDARADLGEQRARVEREPELATTICSIARR